MTRQKRSRAAADGGQRQRSPPPAVVGFAASPTADLIDADTQPLMVAATMIAMAIAVPAKATPRPGF